jgi:hypothetical protein
LEAFELVLDPCSQCLVDVANQRIQCRPGESPVVRDPTPSNPVQFAGDVIQRDLCAPVQVHASDRRAHRVQRRRVYPQNFFSEAWTFTERGLKPWFTLLRQSPSILIGSPFGESSLPALVASGHDWTVIVHADRAQQRKNDPRQLVCERNRSQLERILGRFGLQHRSDPTP